MSTRANIKIYGNGRMIDIYHHHDGYPEGIGKDIYDFLNSKKFFETMTSFGTEKSPADVMCVATSFIKGIPTHFETDNKLDMGYELATGIHGDEEYRYVIDCDSRKLFVYERSWDDGCWNEIKAMFNKEND